MTATASGNAFISQIDGKNAYVELGGIYNVKVRVYYANGEGKPGT